jgi:hypothetical protein
VPKRIFLGISYFRRDSGMGMSRVRSWLMRTNYLLGDWSAGFLSDGTFAGFGNLRGKVMDPSKKLDMVESKEIWGLVKTISPT